MTGGKTSSGLKQRVISGLILAPLVVGIIIAGGWFFGAMILAAAFISLYEFLKLVDGTKNKWFHIIIGTVYLGLCFGSYVLIRTGYEQGAWLALVTILCVWASDTGAYFVGKKVGGPKMAPRLSPNKTWAGLGGSMVFCGISLVLLHYAAIPLQSVLNTNLGLDSSNTPCIFVIGVLLGLVGQAGDLMKSFYKRRAGVKDSGHLIPGHGGLLDRIDSLLLVSVAFLIILQVCL